MLICINALQPEARGGGAEDGLYFFLKGGEANWGGMGALKFPEFQGVSQSEVTLDF